MIGFLITLLVLFVLFVFAGIKVVDQYQRGVVLTLGRYSGTLEPGLRFLFPIVQRMYRVDIRVVSVDVPDQDCITKDNVSVKVNAVIYYKVLDSRKAVMEVKDYQYTISQLAQTTMRDTIGEVTLDDLLAERDQISERIRKSVDKATDPWGLKVDSVNLKDIGLPADMVRTMAKAAEAERERKAVIIRAEGEVIAADNMAKAAQILAGSSGALHLRTLQSINDISSDQSNTVIFAVPLEVLRSFEGFGDAAKAFVKKMEKK